VNIATTYWIKNEYFIYSGWSSIEKNYEKLFWVMDKLNKNGKNIDLVIFGYNISRNLNLRNLILDLKLQNNIYFLWDVDGSHKKLLYQKSLWTIFPSLYESFPFKLAEPLYFWNHILASDLKNIKKIFGDEISYFSPISTNNIFNIINEYLEKCSKIHSKDYKNILKDYNKEETCKQLIGLIW
jgi:glycosyltransferase involved in cell wall biosynthesis